MKTSLITIAYIAASAMLILALGNASRFVAQAPMPRLEPSECPFDRGAYAKDAKIECKWLLIPEVKGNPKSRTIKLAVVVIRALEPDGSPPLVYLHGGPGDSALARVSMVFFDGLNNTRDVVLYDQRGSGKSEPKLCPDYPADAARSQTLPTQKEKDTAFAEARRKCIASLDAEGVDRSAYSTIASAHDLVELRTALGYPVWSLMGSSYGTALAQEAMVQDAKAIRSVILDGPVPRTGALRSDEGFSAQLAFEHVFADCKAQPECNKTFPTLEQDFYDVYKDLKGSPLSVPAQNSDSTTFSFIVHERRLVNRIRNTVLGQPGRLIVLPLLINEFRRGDKLRAARILVGKNPQSAQQGNQVLVNLIICFDKYGKDALERLKVVNAQIKDPFRADYLGDCDQWQKRFATPADQALVKSDIPTLITAGRYDDRTPIEHARLIATGLTKVYVYELPNEGHGLNLNVPNARCRSSIVAQFLKDPFREPDAACIAKLPPVKFLTSWDQAPWIAK